MEENHCLSMAHSHVYSLRAERSARRVCSPSSEKMFAIDETLPNCDANEAQEVAQGTRQVRGRFNNETPEQRERRLQIQREQRGRRHQEPQSKDNIATD